MVSSGRNGHLSLFPLRITELTLLPNVIDTLAFLHCFHTGSIYRTLAIRICFLFFKFIQN